MDRRLSRVPNAPQNPDQPEPGTHRRGAVLLLLASIVVPLLVVSTSSAPSVAGETAAIPSLSGAIPADRPLLGSLLIQAADPGLADLSGSLLPTAHFSFSNAAVATGYLHPVGSPAVPRTPLAEHLARVNQRAIPANATPGAVPRTPIAAYQTAVARRAIQPNETPPAIVRSLPTAQPGALPTALPTPLVPLLPGVRP